MVALKIHMKYKNKYIRRTIMWSIVGYIWAFILGIIGICIAAPIVITLIIGGGIILFYIIVGTTIVICGIINDIL